MYSDGRICTKVLPMVLSDGQNYEWLISHLCSPTCSTFLTIAMYSFKSAKLKLFVCSFGAPMAWWRCLWAGQGMYSRGLRLQAPAHRDSPSGSLWPQQRNRRDLRAAATSWGRRVLREQHPWWSQNWKDPGLRPPQRAWGGLHWVWWRAHLPRHGERTPVLR